ncbi:MAG TPA: ABC-2 transporter permease [Tissierellaceae bacterium]|nr:ABC-2 transporter permease [Tissierellaceae bacterium]
MINLIKKDLRVAFSNRFTNIMLLLFFPFVLFFIGSESTDVLFMFSTFIFVFSLSKITFVFEMRDKSHIFIQSLPVTKKDMVVSKYISIFIYFVMGSIYTLAYIWIFKLLGIINMDKIQFSIILSTLGFITVALSLSLPMQFRFPLKTANFINMMFFMIIIIFISLTKGDFSKFLNLDLNNIYIKLAITGGIVAVYFISIGVSIALYQTRKFY